jgi:hypothetical protein
MTSSICSTLVLFAMLWQSIVMLTPSYIESRVTSFNHFVEHSESLKHHHHDHQTLHLDDTKQSIDHTHSDGGLSSAGLIAIGWSLVWELQPAVPLALGRITIPFPYHEGPLRPPRHSA